MTAQLRAQRFRVAEEREDVGIGEQAAYRVEHLLATALVDQPIMYDGGAHLAPMRGFSALIVGQAILPAAAFPGGSSGHARIFVPHNLRSITVVSKLSSIAHSCIRRTPRLLPIGREYIARTEGTLAGRFHLVFRRDNAGCGAVALLHQLDGNPPFQAWALVQQTHDLTTLACD